MEKHIDVHNMSVFFQTAGTGPTLVLLHGFTESKEIWTHYTSVLRQKFRVVTIDLPGHGKTGVFSGTHGMDFMAEVVDQVIQSIGADPCVLIGHSMGGYVALAYASKHPDKLRGIGLFHSQAGADTKEAAENRLRTVKLIEANRSRFIQGFIPDLFAPTNAEVYTQEIEQLKNQALQMPVDGIVAAMRGMMERDDYLGLLGSTKLPVMIVAGKQDKRIPVEVVLQQSALPNHCELLLLGNAGHMGFIEEQEKTLSFVRDFSLRCFD